MTDTLPNNTIVKKPVKSILISQPEPETKTPFHLLAERYDIKLTFRAFIDVEGIASKDFRKLRINPTDYSAVIFTSRNAIKHFFRICEELRIKISQDMKYFCISETISFYLQKFVQYRKRKIFFGKAETFDSFVEVLKKHKAKENFLLPCAANSTNDELITFLRQHQFKFDEAPIYDTVSCNLTDLDLSQFQIIAFFSPGGVKAFVENFPDFKPDDNCQLAALGAATSKAVEDANLPLSIKAPTPEAPSMTTALENYLKIHNA